MSMIVDAESEATGHATGASASGRIRLTTRGRFFLLGLPVIVLAVAAFLIVSAVMQPAQATTGEPVTAQGDHLITVTVADGDSLWGLAEHYAPERDARDAVSVIQDHNNLEGGLVPGERLVVPATN